MLNENIKYRYLLVLTIWIPTTYDLFRDERNSIFKLFQATAPLWTMTLWIPGRIISLLISKSKKSYPLNIPIWPWLSLFMGCRNIRTFTSPWMSLSDKFTCPEIHIFMIFRWKACELSLEVPHRGISVKKLQHALIRNMKDTHPEPWITFFQVKYINFIFPKENGTYSVVLSKPWLFWAIDIEK